MDDEQNRLERIRREREALQLKPWEFAPSEVDDGPCPYPPTTGGAVAWARAVELLHRWNEARRHQATDNKDDGTGGL